MPNSSISDSEISDPDKLSEKRKTDFLSWLPLAAAILFFLAKLLIISPEGDFPLNDDYSYGLSVRHFLETGDIKLFASCSGCFVQIALGTMATSFTGFSFEVLRDINLCFGFATVIALFLILRELNLDRSVSGLIAFLWTVNPIATNLEFSFMTDTIATTFIAFHIFFFLKALNQDSKWFYLLSAISLSLAVLSRQSSLIFIAATASAFVFKFWNTRKVEPFITATIFLPVAAAFVSENLIQQCSLMLESYNYHKDSFKQFLFSFLGSPLASSKVLLIQLSTVGAYLGLFSLPLLLGIKYKFDKTILKPNIYTAGGLLIGAGFIYKFVLNEARMPTLKNIWNLTEIGASSLIGQVSSISEETKFLVTALAGLGLLLLAYNLLVLSTVKNEGRSLAPLYCSILLALTLGFTAINTSIRGFDRYLLDVYLPALVCLGLSLKNSDNRVLMIPAIVLIAVMGTLTIAQQTEYMNWNRARWQAIAKLKESGVQPDRIDGGAEYSLYKKVDYWKDFEIGVEGKHFAPLDLRGREPASRFRWWPVLGDDYVISLEPIEGYRVFDTIPFSTFGKKEKNKVLILEHDPKGKGESIIDDRSPHSSP